MDKQDLPLLLQILQESQKSNQQNQRVIDNLKSIADNTKKLTQGFEGGGVSVGGGGGGLADVAIGAAVGGGAFGIREHKNGTEDMSADEARSRMSFYMSKEFPNPYDISLMGTAKADYQNEGLGLERYLPPSHPDFGRPPLPPTPTSFLTKIRQFAGEYGSGIGSGAKNILTNTAAAGASLWAMLKVFDRAFAGGDASVGDILSQYNQSIAGGLEQQTPTNRFVNAITGALFHNGPVIGGLSGAVIGGVTGAAIGGLSASGIGAVAGALGGAELGAEVGSIVPVVGTVIGAILGGIAGWALSDEQSPAPRVNPDGAGFFGMNTMLSAVGNGVK